MSLVAGESGQSCVATGQARPREEMVLGTSNISPIRTEIICLGDELLLGIRNNAHLVYLGSELARLGLPVASATEVRDDAEEIRRAFSEAWARSDLVITTGGLGPTEDDLTRETVAEVLGRKLVKHEGAHESMLERFERMGRKPTQNNFRQTYIIEGAEVMLNAHGSAPGQFFQENGKTLVMLPGPANELRPMFAEQVVAHFREKNMVFPGEAYIQLRTGGIGESALETLLKPVFEKFPGRLGVAYCAHAGHVDVRLSKVGHSLSDAELDGIVSECADLLDKHLVGYGETTLAEVVIHHLRKLGRTLAVAESCTGGLLASSFTDVPGASKVFTGGIVCYSNETKIQLLDVPESLIQQHGAVSSECAVAMATGAAERFGADYALSITGYAGPCGGTAENPVGTIFMGVCTPMGVWGHRVIYPGSRAVVKERAVNAALDLIRRKILKYEVYDVLSQMGDS